VPDNHIRDEQRHQAALDYIRQRARTRDAALEGEEPDDDGAEHFHIHLHRSEGDLPPSTGTANPAPGRSSGSPVRVSGDQRVMPLGPPTARAGKFGRDEEGEEPDAGEGEKQSEQVIGSLPDPGEGMVYRLDEQPDGTIAVVLTPDDGAEELSNLNTDNNRRSMSDARSAQIMRAMGKANRAYHTRDSVAAPTLERVIFTHTPTPDEKLIVRQNGNHWELVLVSPTTDLTGTTPPGAEDLPEGNKESDDRQMTGEATLGEPRMERSIGGGKIGDSAPKKLKSMNEMNRRFWSGRGAA
jgi:hypothetical protein